MDDECQQPLSSAAHNRPATTRVEHDRPSAPHPTAPHRTLLTHHIALSLTPPFLPCRGMAVAATSLLSPGCVSVCMGGKAIDCTRAVRDLDSGFFLERASS